MFQRFSSFTRTLRYGTFCVLLLFHSIRRVHKYGHFNMKFPRNVVSAVVSRRSATRSFQVLSSRPLFLTSAASVDCRRCFSSSFFEPEPTLFHPDRLASTEKLDLDVQLRADIKSMGSILGGTIKQYSGEHIFDKVELLRKSAKVR